MFCLSSQQEDIVRVERGGEGRDFHCFGVEFVISLDLEESYWRVRLCISLPGSPTLERRKGETRSMEHHVRWLSWTEMYWIPSFTPQGLLGYLERIQVGLSP